MKKIALIIISCLAILTLAGCTDNDNSETSTTAATVGDTTPVEESEGTQDVLESVREEFGRTPDMTYYTYYYGDNVPDEILNPPTSEEPTPW